LSIGGVGHQVVHQAQFQRFARAEQLAFKDEWLGARQAQQPGHLGDAGSARDQAQRDLGQTELDLSIVHRDAVVPHQCDFPAAAQRRAVQARDHRQAQRLQRAKAFLGLLDLGEHARRIGWLQPHGRLEVGAGEERGLVRGQHDAANRIAIADDLRGHFHQVALPLRAHGVDSGARLVEGEGGDAVGECVVDGFHR
jgi:hypothetical protein